jgi:hypothetical protein
MRRVLVVLVGLGIAVAACGLSLVGTAVPSTDDGGDDAASGTDDGGRFVDLPDAGDAPPVFDGDPGDASVSDGACTPSTFFCESGAECCTGQCATSGACGSCSSTVGAPCASQSDCCKASTWCGRFSKKDQFQCQACLAPDSPCQYDVECCSGVCVLSAKHDMRCR